MYRALNKNLVPLNQTNFWIMCFNFGPQGGSLLQDTVNCLIPYDLLYLSLCGENERFLTNTILN